MLNRISVHGARQHNLKNIDVEIPRNSFTVITGLSGSGKSSLAFDTIYAEGQRRYVETLSTYARQFLDQMERPEVDSIEGLSPAISIEQKTTSRSPRSTVGTITEIYDYLRLLYSSIGTPHCPVCQHEISIQTTGQIVQRVLSLKSEDRIMVLAPVVRGRKGEYKKDLEKLARQGFVRARIDGELRSLDEDIPLDRRKNHTIEVMVDRLLVKPGIEARLEASIETATKLANGLVVIAIVNGEDRLYSLKLACPECGTSAPQLEPRSFSFNSKFGACENCEGLGSLWMFDPGKIIVNSAKPLFGGALAAELDLSYPKWTIESLARKRHEIKLATPFRNLTEAERIDPARRRRGRARGRAAAFAREVQQGLRGGARGARAVHVADQVQDVPGQAAARGEPGGAAEGAVDRRFHGDADFARAADGAVLGVRRARVADRGAAGGGDTESAGVSGAGGARLSEPRPVGGDDLRRRGAAHSPGDADRLESCAACCTCSTSRRSGCIRATTSGCCRRSPGCAIWATRCWWWSTTRRPSSAPITWSTWGRARDGWAGHVVGTGDPRQIARNPNSLTGQYLSGVKEIPSPEVRRVSGKKKISIVGAREHNLKDIDVEIPLGLFTVVTGVSGSGKSTLVNDILYRALAREIYGSGTHAGEHDDLHGAEHVDKVIRIDQSPIGRTPRSNPATYTGLFTPIRDLYAMLPESRERGYKPGRFSFNVKGGRCEACQGDGLKRIEMNFLPDVYVTCDVCRGRRYNYETLEVKYKGYSIADMLGATVEEALGVLSSIPLIAVKLKTLNDVGLGLHSPGAVVDDAFRRRGPADQARQGTEPQTDGAHVLSARRADDRAALRRCPQAARRAAAAGRAGEHGAGDRA